MSTQPKQSFDFEKPRDPDEADSFQATIVVKLVSLFSPGQISV